MRKRIFSAIVCVLVTFSLVGMPAVAAAFLPVDDGIMVPMWDNAKDITLNMSYSGGKVSWNGTVQGKTTTTKITATYKIYKQNTNGTYTLVYTSDTYSANATRLSSTDSYTTAKGTYKLEVSATVVAGGVSEKVSDSLVKTF